MQKTTPNAARRNDASRRAILSAAFDLVQEVGYAKLTIESIAARAGVGKQTIYRWWPSKGLLFFDAFLLLSGGDEGEPPVLPDTGDVRADLVTVLRATVDELNDSRYDQPMRALSTEIAHDPALAQVWAERLDAPMRAAKRERLRAAQQAGQLAGDLDLDVAVDMIWGPVFSRWLHRTGPLTPEYAERVVSTALDGLRPR